MRNTDPFEFFSTHRDTIFRICGIIGALLIVFLILRAIAMRMGGWKAAWARVKRELAVTRNAFAAPFRAWFQHQRRLRRLVHHLGAPLTWRDAERALVRARQEAAPARPYAALVDDREVTVLLADSSEAGTWTIDRTELPAVTPDPDAVRPVIVALGASEDGTGRAVFLDLATGPQQFAIEGDQRAAAALLQAIAAQLDVRLPAGLVTVAEGVHRNHQGEPVRNAYRAARETEPHFGLAPVLIATELPDPLPVELSAPPSADLTVPRVIVTGPGRGHVRRLLADRHSRVYVTGTPLLPFFDALGRALARVLPHIPPVLPPAPPTGNAASDLFEEAEGQEQQQTTLVKTRKAEPEEVPLGRSAATPLESVADAEAGETSAGPAADATAGTAPSTTSRSPQP
ncbi:hypothetical protein SUDANB171_02986 [Streptomyces sp. enrichment culture]|uniref:hypothetical protein n=1 Tax=Streptomyces xiamenensis TaxID=408015 RepID=UPI0036E308C8